MHDPLSGPLHEGQSLTSPPVTMTQADILAFARSFDPQPMHTDPEAAASSPVGGLIASGWHTAAVALRLQREAGLAAGAPGDIASLAWPRPVRPGDQLHARVDILARRASPDHDHVQFQNTVINQHGETVQVMTGTVLLPRQTAPAQ